MAVSTAGPQLDYMVVADTATAQRCIDLLRRQGLGVATFLMLDKQAHLASQAAQAVQPPEGACLSHFRMVSVFWGFGWVLGGKHR